ncbi:MAG: cell division protein SepF [Oscillospiraceae bacterium]|nr:cell division protein SepF [Oscillospiraceae bacterium]
MGAREFLDRLFRGDAVSDEEYGAYEPGRESQDAEPRTEPGYHAGAGFRSEAGFRFGGDDDDQNPYAYRAKQDAPKPDNVVEFTRTRASATPPEPPAEDFMRSGSFGAFGGDSGGDGGNTREFGGSGGGGGFSGGRGGSAQLSETADAYVVFKRLQDFQTASQVADRLIEGKIVILNLESCDVEVARRVMDFIGGVAYACSSLVKRIAGRVFMITPQGVSSDGEFFDEARGGGPDIRYDDLL